MGTRGLLLALFALMILAPASARAQTDPPVPAAPEGTPAERLDEAVAFFLLDSLTVRNKLRAQGMDERADGYWKSASKFVELVRAADTELAPQFIPILDGFRRSLRETAIDSAAVDLEGLAGIKSALDDQNEIYSAPGAFQGGRSTIDIVVNAIDRTGKPVSNLYVWLDLAGSVPKGTSANALANVTSPARGSVGPGKYLVRLMRQDGNAQKEVARRADMRIGKNGNKETIDVVVP